MAIEYTDIWNGFQFRNPIYVDGHIEPYKFDLVKWEEHNLGKSCFSVGRLEWDPKEEYFTFESVGLRYLNYRIDGLEKWILDFCEMMSNRLAEV